MYGGYQGAYGAYGNQQAASQPYQQQGQQNYYPGVNPYAANYGYAAAQLPPPPPPPPVADPYAGQFQTFPSQATKIAPNPYFKKPQNQQQQGYDAAVYNYAQQNTPKNWKHGGGGRQGRQGSGDNKQYYCEVCKISCAGGITYKEHLEGQRHKKKEAMAKQGIPSTSLAKNKLSYRCDLCDVTCTGQDTYSAHVRGGKHLKTAQLHKKLGKPVPEDVPTIIAPGADGPTETKAKPKWHQQALPGGKIVIGINTVNFVGGTKLNSTGQLEEKKREVAAAVSSVGRKTGGAAATTTIEVEDEKLRAMIAAEEVQPVGEEHVTEERDATGKLVQFHCKLCDCKFSDPNAKEIHIKGRRHRVSYRQKIDPTLVVDVKPSNKRSQEKRKNQLPAVHEPPSFMKTPWFAPPAPEGREFNIVDDRTINEKYAGLNPGVEFISNVDRLISDINESLKYVSDKIERDVRKIPEDVVELPTTTTTTEQPPRTVLGCSRVGIIAKGTFIKGDRCAEVVLTCTPVPTSGLVEQIRRLFGESTTSLTIEPDPESPSSLIVTANYFPNMKCRILITSAVVRKDDDSIVTGCAADKDLCIYALASIRNTKWYDSHCQYLNSCQSVIRLLRDLRNKYPEVACLDDYKMELIVSNIIDSSPMSLGLSDAFKRIVEALASGYLYSAILSDPCETSRPNVLDALTDEQKHSLTALAQNFVRQIAFNQIHEILGIDRLQDTIDLPEDAPMLKRPLESNENAENAENLDDSPVSKKEKLDEEPADI
ncbi:DZF domain-containing protein [Caenorhabditis elegans]|uniref:DZF domain-containing protein n=1 Tax=Caenorhabditis elegans TaxID=6239 RepID=E9RKC7_CAEEL|nr:DZF domain-containing protein [Caenorhabditis elegans]CCD73557.1 DZF domain-containing protein [Caenorhabditis elegans]|eukprot:NP_490785.3 Uncharacterized protein CELE_Y95B8A.8 [Caenorhabditis elegans]